MNDDDDIYLRNFAIESVEVNVWLFKVNLNNLK